ncbi:hypothetical protein Spico_0237 [Parasphaerochaeta coccoides DSM 17374]|uniref:Uncharacterized protein n=1 Tax=Parasphaerochaeta coccoides (strain ATCC BAA-1237 / DSM 17374 / SPN1) TaxID=760011 RepID=F4GKR2_PARC1|nr:hypothetical protein Spico_0237 [Parasphaerochaeta coccoides DSM 17374]
MCLRTAVGFFRTPWYSVGHVMSSDWMEAWGRPWIRPIAAVMIIVKSSERMTESHAKEN